MNILWIEDFGTSDTPQGSMVKQIFQALIPSLSVDDTQIDLSLEPEVLTSLVKQTGSYHQVVLRNNCTEFQEIEADILEKFDVVILDLSLGGEPPEKKAELESMGYKSDLGGLFIYNRLIYKGFSPENICILTGEKNSLQDFERRCREILISKPPRSFEKVPDDYQQLRTWLTQKEKNIYLTLRRGIIKACQDIETYIEKDINRIQFGAFLKNKPENEELKVNMVDYLDTLKNFLPLSEPTDKARLYKLFVRSLAHEWEDNASPKNLKKPPKKLSVFGWIMKCTRNWIAHNRFTLPFDEVFVGFLFIIAMRSMFKLDENTQIYEKILFSLFENAISPDELTQLLDNNQIPLANTYMQARNLLPQQDITQHYPFNEIVNKLELPNSTYSYVQALYQIYWLTLPDVKTETTLKDEKGDTWIFSTEFKLKERSSYGRNQFEDKSGDFLFEFSRHIYPYSF